MLLNYVAILYIKVFGYQFFKCHAKYSAKGINLDVCHISFLRFYTSDDIFVHVVSFQLKLIGKFSLRKTMFFSQRNEVFAYQIFLSTKGTWLWHTSELLCLTFCYLKVYVKIKENRL